jgi:hypothetical protein
MFGVESKAARRWQIERCDGEGGSAAEILRVGEKTALGIDQRAVLRILTISSNVGP